ncbi:MAG: hypothetical protein E6J20_00460, partial [Chloroflexi bacterium]
ERTADTAANRCLKMAVWILARSYGQSADLNRERRRLAARLNAAYRLFEDAELDFRLAFLADPLVLGTATLPTTRDYYRNALDVARLVVTNSSVHLDRAGSDVHMPSLLIAMDEVFERYVRNVLRDGFASIRPDLRVLDGNREGKKLLFDAAPSEPAKPDIVIRAPDSSTPVVMDVKYRPASGKPDRADINQVITYAASYRASIAVVVQPRAENSPRNRLMQLGNIVNLGVFQYVMDLGADLDEEEAALIEAVAALVPGTAHAIAI